MRLPVVGGVVAFAASVHQRPPRGSRLYSTAHKCAWLIEPDECYREAGTFGRASTGSGLNIIKLGFFFFTRFIPVYHSCRKKELVMKKRGLKFPTHVFHPFRVLAYRGKAQKRGCIVGTRLLLHFELNMKNYSSFLMPVWLKNSMRIVVP